MPENKDTGDRSLSDVQLDDFDVNRQRERLERSRPSNLESEQQQTAPQSGELKRGQDKP